MDIETANWRKYKEELAEDGYLLRSFLEGIEESVALRLDMHQVATFYYEPLLYEMHLEDLTALVERCLAYRREARELEILAVKAATDYAQFKALSAIDEQTDELRLRLQQVETARDYEAEASVRFGQTDNLAKGFATLSGGRANEYTLDIEDINKQRALIAERYRILHKYHDDYNSKYNEPGNAHNFGYRRDRVVELYAEDLTEARQKATAIMGGVWVVYQKHFPLPDTTSIRYLDDFMNWTRRMIQFVEAQAQDEAEYDIIVPLVQPWRKGGKPFVTTEEFNSALDAARKDFAPLEIKFDLSGVFQNQDNVRVQGIGLSYGNQFSQVQDGSDIAAVIESYRRLRASIQTPEQVTPFGEGSSYKRPPILLGNVTLYGGSASVAFEANNLCHNINPNGLWVISIEPYSVFKDERKSTIFEEVEPQSSILQDLKLHLRIASKPQALNNG